MNYEVSLVIQRHLIFFFKSISTNNAECKYRGTKEASQLELREINKAFFMKEIPVFT